MIAEDLDKTTEEERIAEVMISYDKLVDFMGEFKELLQKHNVDFVNRDAFDSEDKYSHTDVFMTLDGNVWYGDTFHEILGEILLQIQDGNEGRV